MFDWIDIALAFNIAIGIWIATLVPFVIAVLSAALMDAIDPL